MKVVASAVLLLFLAVPVVHAQDIRPIDHARHVRELLVQEKFADVVSEFNTQMAAALTAERLAQVWAMIKQQVGEYQSELSVQTATEQGFTVVLVGCRFEREALNMVVAFDMDGNIAGLQFVPR